MPSIAQQDYLRLRIENLLSLTEDEKAKIRSAIFDTHTIFDTLIETNDGDVVSRVVEVNDSNSEITIVVGGVIETIGYSED